MVYRRQDTQGHDTAVIISMLAGVGGHHKIKVDALRALKSQKLQDEQT